MDNTGNHNREDTEAHRRYFRENYGVEYTDEEAIDAWRNLVGFFDLLLKVDRRIQAQGRDGGKW
jgi:hypothetical protein